MKQIIILCSLILILPASINAQELYPFTEPASNMPANSISAKHSLKLLKGYHSNKIEQRHSPEIMFGMSKSAMVHLGVSFSDMYSNKLQWESARLYSQFRLYTNDAVHRHFRLATFVRASYSRNGAFYDELTLEGDQSGVQFGMIATQLINKLALSASVSNVQILQNSRNDNIKSHPYQAVDYSFSSGYLLFPRNYSSYKQTNLNLYLELLGQKTYDLSHFFVDLAPSIQLIFNSNSKLNLGYRFEVNGDMHRMAKNSWMLSFERTFLGVLKKK